MIRKCAGIIWEQYKKEMACKNLVIVALVACIIFSIIGAVFGFYFWYQKLQSLLDTQVRLEVAKLTNEVSKTN
jgi:uncharacterized membrane protein YpjA